MEIAENSRKLQTSPPTQCNLQYESLDSNLLAIPGFEWMQ